MTNNNTEWHFSNSCLKVCGSGIEMAIAHDLQQPNGKNIKELLDEQETQKSQFKE